MVNWRERTTFISLLSVLRYDVTLCLFAQTYEETWHSRFAISRKRGYCRIYFTTTTGTTGTTPLEQIIEEAVLEAVLWGLLDDDFRKPHHPGGPRRLDCRWSWPGFSHGGLTVRLFLLLRAHSGSLEWKLRARECPGLRLRMQSSESERITTINDSLTSTPILQ